MWNPFRNWWGKGPVNTIPPSWAAVATATTQYTPDILELQSRKSTLLFTPDEMQKGHTAHHLLDGHALPLGRAITDEQFSYLSLRVENAISVRVPLRERYNSVPYLPIQGELWAVQPGHMPVLDTVKQNGLLYQRGRVKLTFLTREKRNISRVIEDPVHCWMYVGRREIWSPQVDGGYNFTPVKTFESRDRGGYYCYTRLEADGK